MNPKLIEEFDRLLGEANKILDATITEYHDLHGASSLSEPEDVLQDENISRLDAFVRGLTALRAKL
jgi:hypothetical protein